MLDNTIDYYNARAESFVADTVSVGFKEMRSRFTDKLPNKARILDFGCGSGRDTKAFLEQGYRVDAIDGSEKLCRIASEYTGIAVRHMYFQQLDEINGYDGIWACASILHLRSAELPDVLRRMMQALKENGIIYASFKYGDFEGEKQGRYFTDMTEDAFAKIVATVDGLHIEEQWVSRDVRPGRGDEKWLNLILRKN